MFLPIGYRGQLFLALFLSVSLAALDSAFGQKNFTRSFKNDGLVAADGFTLSLNQTNGVNTIYQAEGYREVPPNYIGKTVHHFPARAVNAISLTVNPFPGDGSLGSNRVSSKATLGVAYRGDRAGIDQTTTRLLIAGADSNATKFVSLDPDINYLGGNQYQLVLANVSGVPINVNSFALNVNDPGDPSQLDTYTPGGTPVAISLPSNPLPAGYTQSINFTGNPLLAVNVSDVVSTTSDPDSGFFDLTAVGAVVPEPASALLICLGLLAAACRVRSSRK